MSSQLLVRSMTAESDGVLSVELIDAQGHELPSWEPGAHLDVQLTAGLSRQYSLSGDPHDRLRYRIAVLREPAGRGGSAYKRRVSTSSRRTWDIAPLLVIGVALGLLGQTLADSHTGWAGALSLTGLVLLLSGLFRWSRRTRRRAALGVTRGSMTTAA